MVRPTAILPDFWWEAVNTCCLETLGMCYGLNPLFGGRRFIKLLFEWKFRNMIDGSVLHGAVSTDEAYFEVFRPASVVLSVRGALFIATK